MAANVRAATLSNGQKGLPALTKNKDRVAGLGLSPADPSADLYADPPAQGTADGKIAGSPASIELAALTQPLNELGDSTVFANNDQAPLQMANADASNAQRSDLGKLDADTVDAVQHINEPVTLIGDVAAATPSVAGVSGALSTPAMVGIGLGSAAIGIAAGSGSGSSAASSAGATASGVTEPAAPTVKIAASSDGGAVGDLITNDSTATLEGTGTAGDSITVTSSTGLTMTTTVAADGTWSVTPTTPLADGTVTFSIVEKGAAAGAVASAPVVVAVTIDTVGPVAGTVDAIANDGTVNGYEATGFTMTGMGAEAGASVSALISDGSGHSKTVAGVVAADGSWAVPTGALSGMPDGNYTVIATIADAAGNQATSNRSFVLDTTGPATPAMPDMAAASDSGVSNSDNITNINTPVFVVAEPGAGETGTLVVDGVKVLATHDNVAHTLTLNNALAEGVHAITYALNDAQGNIGMSSALSVTIDTQQATPAAPTMTAATDTGPSDSDRITGNPTPAFQVGPLAAGESPELFINGSGTALAGTYDSASGVFSTSTPFADGTYYATYWVHDAAGNTSLPSSGMGFTIDTVAPTQTAVIAAVTDNVGSVTGSLSSGASTDDASPLLSGTLSAALGTNEHLVVYRDGVALGDATVVGTDWSYQDGGVTASATPHVYTTQVADAVGHQSTPSASFSLTENPLTTIGGSAVDTLTGNDPGSNDLWGGAGADHIIGGPGTDYARYDFATSAVTANLSNSALNTGEAAGDTYTSIEGLHGSGYNDTLVGDANANIVYGHDGDDVISLGAGNDYVLGGRGSDTLTGGAGNDTFAFTIAGADPKQNGNADVITDFHSVIGDQDVITLTGVTDSFVPPGGPSAPLAITTADGHQVLLFASAPGADLLLTFNDTTANTQYTVTLAGRSDLFLGNSVSTLQDMIANTHQMVLSA